jgi:hypothetical protein
MNNEPDKLPNLSKVFMIGTKPEPNSLYNHLAKLLQRGKRSPDPEIRSIGNTMAAIMIAEHMARR